MDKNVAPSMKAGLAFALIGGIVAFFAMAFALAYAVDGSGMDTVADAGLYLLMAVLFFALAGGFTRYAQWTQNVLIFMAFLTLGAAIGGFAAGYFELWFGIIEAVLGALCVAAAFMNGTARFLALRQAQ
ncbi:hypothetical protein TALC_00156 [Thermoplasmatales archaeon BRNA1]|nr:hypothetical protein TALC_00156 [Thermoplasmatales archaeon BRNA1]